MDRLGLPLPSLRQPCEPAAAVPGTARTGRGARGRRRLRRDHPLPGGMRRPRAGPGRITPPGGHGPIADAGSGQCDRGGRSVRPVCLRSAFRCDHPDRSARIRSPVHRGCGAGGAHARTGARTAQARRQTDCRHRKPAGPQVFCRRRRGPPERTHGGHRGAVRREGTAYLWPRRPGRGPAPGRSDQPAVPGTVSGL